MLTKQMEKQWSIFDSYDFLVFDTSALLEIPETVLKDLDNLSIVIPSVTLMELSSLSQGPNQKPQVQSILKYLKSHNNMNTNVLFCDPGGRRISWEEALKVKYKFNSKKNYASCLDDYVIKACASFGHQAISCLITDDLNMTVKAKSFNLNFHSSHQLLEAIEHKKKEY